MACGLNACYSTSPVTTTITYTTTEDGSTVTLTSTSVTTPPVPTEAASNTDDGAVVKFFPTAIAKASATSSSSSSDSNGGLSKGVIGGIVAAAAVLLIAVLAAAFFVIKRLKRTEKFVQTQRETTSGTRTRGGGHTTEKNKSEVNVRVQPTPSEVDAMDYDPLMMNSSVASPLRPGLLQQQQLQQQQRGRGRGRHSRTNDSDTASQGVSVWSGGGTDVRWQTPSIGGDSDADRTYFELPPRSEREPPGAHVRDSLHSDGSDSQYYYNYAYGHGRHHSNASELSAGSDDGSHRGGPASPLIGSRGRRRGGSGHGPAELDVDGAYTPELPGSGSASDTETDSAKFQGRQPRPRRRSTRASINNIVSPISVMSARPPAAHANPGRMRRQRQDSIVSPMDGGAQNAAGVRLRSIDESATTGREAEVADAYDDLGESPIVPGMVSIGPSGLAGEARPSHESSER